jgi:MFS family permease
VFGAVFGAVAGNVMFLLLTANLTGDQFIAWGWRVPFLTGLLLVVIGIYVQLKIEDTPVFRAMREESAATKRAAGCARRRSARRSAATGARSCRPPVRSSWSTRSSTF